MKRFGLFGGFCALLFGVLLSAPAMRSEQTPPQTPAAGARGQGQRGQAGQRGRGQQPQRKQVLAWADIRFGAQHESVSRALATIDKLGDQTGLWDTYFRTDSDVITKKQISVIPRSSGIMISSRRARKRVMGVMRE